MLALRARLGTIELVRGTDREEVPVVERFFSGGSNSVRGFDYKELGPLDADGDPTGGLSWSELSAELRFPIWWLFGGVVFFDAGQVQLAPNDWDPDGFETAIGTGLRFGTPIGPVGLDVGFPLDPNRGDSKYRIHLSVGHAF